MATNTSAYIDIEKLIASEFSPHAHANALVLNTNNASDPVIDLTTPLSRALFDLQEIDTNIHNLTSRSALDILSYTSTQNAAAGRIIVKVEEERSRLNASYARLEKEILGQYTKATNAKLHAERSSQVLKLGRNVQRVLSLARQFETLISESGLSSSTTQPPSRPSTTREDHRTIVRATYIILNFRDLMSAKDSTELSKINLVRTIRGRIFEDGEARILDYARKVVREFTVNTLTNPSTTSTSISTTTSSTYKESEDSKSRFTSAAQILYLLSPAPQIEGQKLKKQDFEAEYLLRALQGYLQTAITSSSAGIARALGQLPILDRALLEVSARCQNIIALEALLQTIIPPDHPNLLQSEPSHQHTKRKAIKAHNNTQPSSSEPLSSSSSSSISSSSSDDDEDTTTTATLQNPNPNFPTNQPTPINLLTLTLTSLETPSLPSYFWRSLATQLTPRVQEILNRGGIAARTLRSNKEEVRIQIRDCVLRGGRIVSNGGIGGKEQNWEREAAVMAGSVIGVLGR